MNILVLIINLFFLMISTVISAEYTEEYISSGSDITNISSFKLSNNGEFSSFKSNGSWTDNFGNYGKNKCMGIINKINNKVSIVVMCESIDKNGYKTWALNKREGTFDSGVGSYEIVDATIPKKELYIGTKCIFAIKYLGDTNFYKSKCKISKELATVFEKIANEKQSPSSP